MVEMLCVFRAPLEKWSGDSSLRALQIAVCLSLDIFKYAFYQMLNYFGFSHTHCCSAFYSQPVLEGEEETFLDFARHRGVSRQT